MDSVASGRLQPPSHSPEAASELRAPAAPPAAPPREASAALPPRKGFAAKKGLQARRKSGDRMQALLDSM